jgi:protein-disulfide isomerase
VNGTPRFFINNRRYDEPPDYKPLVATIAAQLEDAPMPA